MSPEAIFFCYLVAIVAFAIATFRGSIPPVSLVPLGLAFWLLPTFWAAMKAL